MSRRPPMFPALLVLSTCVSVSSTTTEPPPPPPPPPPGPFADFTHPDSASSAVAMLENLTGAPLFRSFAAFAPALSTSGGHAPVPLAPGGSPRCSGRVPPLPVPATVHPPGPGLSAIPDSVQSHIFAYDSATQAFRSIADTGGPAQGVRFLLAGADSLGRPLFPLVTVGWFDIIDRSVAGRPDSVEGVLAGGAGPLLSYSMVPTGTSSAYSERIAGRLGGSGSGFVFRDSTARIGSQVSVTATVDDTAGGVHATLTATRTSVDRYDWFYALDFTLRFGGDSIRLKGSSDVYCLLPSIGVTVLVHDTVFATVTNGSTPDNPAITRGDRNPVTASQAAAVLDLIRVQAALFNWMETFSLPGSLLLGS